MRRVCRSRIVSSTKKEYHGQGPYDSGAPHPAWATFSPDLVQIEGTPLGLDRRYTIGTAVTSSFSPRDCVAWGEGGRRPDEGQGEAATGP
jgi:hypothetical protein